MKTLKIRPFRPSVAKRRDDEAVVQNGLSVTPAEMMDLTNQGLAIGAYNQMVLDTVNVSDKDFHVPMEYQRHVDMADMWVASQDLREKIRNIPEKVKSGEVVPIVESQDD